MQQGQHLGFLFPDMCPLLIQPLFQDLLNLVTVLGVEQLPQDLSLFHGTGQQKLPEFALCDHDDLAELFAVHAGQFHHFVRHCLCSGTEDLFFLCRLIRKNLPEFCLCLLFYHAAAAECRTQIRRCAIYQILFVPAEEPQFYTSDLLGVSILTAKLLRIADIAACRSIKGVADRIKNGSFSRTGFAGDQIDPRLVKGRKVNAAFLCKCPECFHR